MGPIRISGGTGWRGRARGLASWSQPPQARRSERGRTTAQRPPLSLPTFNFCFQRIIARGNCKGPVLARIAGSGDQAHARAHPRHAHAVTLTRHTHPVSLTHTHTRSRRRSCAGPTRSRWPPCTGVGGRGAGGGSAEEPGPRTRAARPRAGHAVGRGALEGKGRGRAAPPDWTAPAVPRDRPPRGDTSRLLSPSPVTPLLKSAPPPAGNRAGSSGSNLTA